MSPHGWFRGALVAVVGVLLSVAMASTAAAQGIGTVRGRVTDEVSGRPINAVQVFVPGTDLGTFTDENGDFELNLAAGSYTIRVRRVGYSTTSQPTSLAAGQVVELNFQLTQNVIVLDEVVVTGAGAATEKKRLGNTIASIKAADLENAPVLNFSEMIAAREPGVVIQPSGGLAGEGSRIRIRGSASLSQNNEPIVYVDGIRVDRGGGFGSPLMFVGGGGAPSRLDDINPDAIERVEVLKGAAAATLYGTEASNGVIQIFTKKGARGAPQFDFSIEQGLQAVNQTRYKTNTGFARDDATQLAGDFLTADQLSQFWGFQIRPFEIFEVDYFDPLLENGWAQVYSGSVSGGTSGLTYFVSGRFSREDGPITGEEVGGVAEDINKKIQGTANLEILPSDKLKIRVNTQISDVSQLVPQNNNNILGFLPAAMDAKPERATCETSFGVGTPNGDGTCDPVGNPEGATFATVKETAQNTITQNARHYLMSVQMQYSPVSELVLDATVGVDVTNVKDAEFFPFGWNVDLLSGFDTEGIRDIADRRRREITLETKLQWDRRFGENISSTFVAGGQGFIARNETTYGRGADFPGPGLEVAGAGASQIIGEQFLEIVNAGAFAQEQLGYKDFLFLTVGGRYDRNSAFGESTSGTFYPKVSLSFVPSDLSSWNSRILSTVRLRGALGQSGLQPGAFDKFTTFDAAASELGPGLVADQLGNQDLKPEKATEWEVGAEFGLFDDRLGFDVTYWDRVTKDALFARQFAPSGGFVNQQVVNIGRLDAKGFEIAANALVINQPDLSVRLFANAAFLDEIVTDLGDAPPIKVGGSYVRYRNWLREGFAPGAYFGAKLVPFGAGFTPYDLDGDGQPDSEADMLAFFSVPRSLEDISGATDILMEDGLESPLGKPVPDWQGSFGTSISLWGNLEIGSVFEYKTGNFSIHNLTDSFRATHPNIGRNFREATEVELALLNPASTPEQRLAAAMTFAQELPHLFPRSGLNAIEKGDFLRWRELNVSYRLPRQWVQQRLGLRYVTLNAAIRNLVLWTGYSGIDPETNLVSRGGDPGSAGETTLDNNFGDGIDAWGVPLPRRFTFSVRFGF